MFLKLFKLNLTLFITLFTCFLKDRCWSIIIHKYLTCVTNLIASPLNIISGFTEFCFHTVKYVHTVLLTLRDKQDSFNQSETFTIVDDSLLAASSLVLA